jgi:hypothetical protein
LHIKEKCLEANVQILTLLIPKVIDGQKLKEMSSGSVVPVVLNHIEERGHCMDTEVIVPIVSMLIS